jgi:copper oxidase (laccase) domain-containing protein
MKVHRATDAPSFLGEINMANKDSRMEWQSLIDLGDEWRHRFVMRHPEVVVDAEREEVVARLWPWHEEQMRGLGFGPEQLVRAEQVHGAGVAVVKRAEGMVAGVDGLISNEPGLVLGIYVADCCAVYLVEPEAGSFGLVHSGKRGSELNIVGEAIRLMVREHGACPGRMKVVLSPCIRPPRYEVDFAEQIREGALEAGVIQENVMDSGVCTATDLLRFYSYRAEKGRTGRMLALLGRRESCLR